MRKVLLLCALSLSFTAQSATPPGAVNVSNRPLLVVAGASYAGSWKIARLGQYSIVNRGKGGDETSQVLARFDSDVLALKPDAVLIWGHINDIHRASPDKRSAARERAKANLRAMVEKAREQGVVVMVGTEITLSKAIGLGNRLAAFINDLRGKEGYSAKINAEVRSINDWLRGYAREQGLKLFDFERVLDDGEGFREVEYTSADGTHVSDAGYAALTSYAEAEITR